MYLSQASYFQMTNQLTRYRLRAKLLLNFIGILNSYNKSIKRHLFRIVTALLYSMITHYKLAVSFGLSTFVLNKQLPCLEELHQSALQSAAFYLCQLFSTQSDTLSLVSDLVGIETLPAVDYDQHRSYVAWNIKLKDCVLAQRAVKDNQTLYFDIVLEQNLIQQVSKLQKDVWSDYEYKTMHNGLSNEERLRQIFGLWEIPRLEKKVAIFSNTVCTIERFRYLDAANILGSFYNNQRWYFYEITESPEDQIPTIQEIQKLDVVILPGSPRSVYEKHSSIEKAMSNLKAAYESCEHMKIQAICYGHQLVAYHFGVDVEKRNKCRLIEKIEMNRQIIARHSFLDPLYRLAQNSVFVSKNHADHVVAIPEGFELLGKSASCEIQSLVSTNGRIFTTQFHPEIYHCKLIKEQEAKVIESKMSASLQKEALRLLRQLRRENINNSLLIRECMLKFINQ